MGLIALEKYENETIKKKTDAEALSLILLSDVFFLLIMVVPP